MDYGKIFLRNIVISMCVILVSFGLIHITNATKLSVADDDIILNFKHHKFMATKNETNEVAINAADAGEAYIKVQVNNPILFSLRIDGEKIEDYKNLREGKYNLEVLDSEGQITNSISLEVIWGGFSVFSTLDAKLTSGGFVQRF